MVISSPATVMAPPQSRNDVSLLRVVMWTVVFQIGWYWERYPQILMEGAFRDTDDFQRLSQVRDWIGGQGWWDVTNYAMNPPEGAAMHWSRLVDVPLALLIRFFDLFMPTLYAERLTAIVWPLALMVCTVLLVVAICRRLDPRTNPLLVLLFTVTWFAAVTEFRPGRLDHHSVQIVLFCCMLYGLSAPGWKWAGPLIGLAAVASIAVGLDSILLIAFVFCWLAIRWVAGNPKASRDITGTGWALLLATPPFFLASVPPAVWFAPYCDANSVVYASGLLFAGIVFVTLPTFISLRIFSRGADTWQTRLMLGTAFALPALALIVYAWPHCLKGPYAGLSDELVSVWLRHVSEAKGILGILEMMPQMWLMVVAHCLLVWCATAWFAWTRRRGKPQYLALVAVFTISLLVSFLQYRALRIGVFAAIPPLVGFAMLAVGHIGTRLQSRPLIAALAKAMFTALFVAQVWHVVAELTMGSLDSPKGAAASEMPVSTPAWISNRSYTFCNREPEYAALAALPAARVMADLNSGPAMIVFTHHQVVAGPYHRNGDAIIDTMRFFNSDLGEARKIAQRREIELVAFCTPLTPAGENDAAPASLANLIRSENEPSWLQRITGQDQRIQIFRVVP